MQQGPVPSNRLPRKRPSRTADSKILMEAAYEEVDDFIDFADTHFALDWHHYQPPIIRATLLLMIEDLINIARQTITGVLPNASFGAFGLLSECACCAAFKCMRDDSFSQILAQIAIDGDGGEEEGADWIRRIAIRSGETDCFDGIPPDITCVIRATSGMALNCALSDMEEHPELSCHLTREAIFDCLVIAAQMGEEAEAFALVFEGDDYLRRLAAIQDLRGRLAREAAGDVEWYKKQLATALRQRED